MDCFSDSPQPYKIVKFTPEACKPYVDAVLKRNIRFTNPYEVANYFFVLHSNGYKGFKEIDLIFVKMNDTVYYFKNVYEMLIRFTSEECKEEWIPVSAEKINDDRELYVVLDYAAPGIHLIFEPEQIKNQLKDLFPPQQYQESFSYKCTNNGNLWKLLQHTKKNYAICSTVVFLHIFASKNILGPLIKSRLTIESEGTISAVIDKNTPFATSSTRFIPGIPKYLVTKDGKVYGDGMKLIKHTKEEKHPRVVLVVKGTPTLFYVKDLVESAWATEEEVLPDVQLKNDHEDLPEIEEKDYLSHTEEAINAFVSLYTGDTWVDEVSKIIESNHETKKYFLSFLRSFASNIPKNEALEAALDTTKYEPLISLLDSEVVLVPDPVVYNIFDST